MEAFRILAEGVAGPIRAPVFALCWRFAREHLILHGGKTRSPAELCCFAQGRLCSTSLAFLPPGEAPAAAGPGVCPSPSPIGASASSLSPIQDNCKGSLQAEGLQNEEPGFDLPALRRAVESYLLLTSRGSSSSKSSERNSSKLSLSSGKAGSLNLLEFLPLLTPSRLQQLPAADVLLLLHVYSRLAQKAAQPSCPPAAAAAAEAAKANCLLERQPATTIEGDRLTAEALLLFLARGARVITERPLDFLLPPQLTQVVVVSSAFPPTAVPLDFWRCLLRRCSEASRLLSPPEAARLLVALAHLPPLPENAALRPAVSALCGRLAGAPEGLRNRGALLQVLQALRRLQVMHAPLLTEIARALQQRFASGRSQPASPPVSPPGATSSPPPVSDPPKSSEPQASSYEASNKALLLAGLSCFAAQKAVEFQPLFKTLADALAKIANGLILHEAAQVLAALGTLDCYPEGLLKVLLPHASSLLFAQRFLETEAHAGGPAGVDAPRERMQMCDVLSILRSLGQLQKRDAAVLREALPLFVQGIQRDCLSLRDCVSVLYECYRLDLWHPSLAKCILSSLHSAPTNGLLDRLGLQGATNLLLALSYFQLDERSLFEALLSQLLRHVHRLSTPAISQLQTVELALRTGHLPFDSSSLSAAARDTLQRAKATVTEPERLYTSALQEKVAKTATFLQCHYYSEVVVGPYTLDFAQPLDSEELQALQQQQQRSLRMRPLDASCFPAIEQLRAKAVVIEVDGPQHFYRDSLHWNSSSKLKHKLLSRLGFRIVHIPYYDVLPLTDPRDLREYVSNAVAHALRPAESREAEVSIHPKGDDGPHLNAEASAALSSLLEKRRPDPSSLEAAEGDASHITPEDTIPWETILGRTEAFELPASLKQKTREARLADPKKSLCISLTRLRRQKAQEQRQQAERQTAARRPGVG